MSLISVDFPAPFSPSKACTSPACNWNDTPLSARTAPKDLVTFVSCSSGEVMSSPLAQHVLLVPLHFRQPPITHGNAPALAIRIPHRSERKRFRFFLQRQAGGEVPSRFGGADSQGLQQTQQQRPQHVARADYPCGDAVDAGIKIVQPYVHALSV